MLTLTVCVLFVTCAIAYDMKFEYHVSEGKARFMEKIETNLEKNVVKFDVPAHNNILESHKMQDFLKGKQITCLPSLKECRLRDIDRQNAVDAGQLTESFVHSWNQGVNSISSTNSTVIRELYYISDEIMDTVSLGENLKTFYEGFGYTLYQEKKIPKDAVILDIVQSTGNRVKRSFLTLYCNGQSPKMVYGLSNGASSIYMKTCKHITTVDGLNVFSDCGNVHITSSLAYGCLCCPWITQIINNGHDCFCTKLSGSN